jgi:hypothetical protein
MYDELFAAGNHGDAAGSFCHGLTGGPDSGGMKNDV